MKSILGFVAAVFLVGECETCCVAADAANTNVTVEVLIFSGRPNPTWQLQDTDGLHLLKAKLKDLPTAFEKEPADWSRTPDERVMRAQLRVALAAAVRELPEIYRAPVVLRDIEGLTTAEASSRLRVKDQTLKSRLHRGRLMLRERLQVFRSGLSLHRSTPAYS